MGFVICRFSADLSSLLSTKCKNLNAAIIVFVLYDLISMLLGQTDLITWASITKSLPMHLSILRYLRILHVPPSSPNQGDPHQPAGGKAQILLHL